MDIKLIETGDVKTSSGIHFGRYTANHLNGMMYEVVVRWANPKKADDVLKGFSLEELKNKFHGSKDALLVPDAK